MLITIRNADALLVDTDVLIVKYAQALYGIDAQVVGRLDDAAANIFPKVPLPSPGTANLVESRGLIGARAVLLVGVKPVGAFGYAEIRAFSKNALSTLVQMLPGASHAVMTLHGVGFGLDETEAFRAELAGILEAVQCGELPQNLSRIDIVEHDVGRVERLRRQLDEILPGGSTDLVGETLPSSTGTLPAVLQTAGDRSKDKAHVFVAMPFAKEFDDRFHYGIHPAIRAAGYLCERADMATYTGDVLSWVKDRIATADMLVADLSGANPNVYLEVGYAWGCGRPTVLVASDAKDLMFDVRSQRCLIYEHSIRTLEAHLTAELQKLAAVRSTDITPMPSSDH